MNRNIERAETSPVGALRGDVGTFADTRRSPVGAPASFNKSKTGSIAIP